MILTKKTLVAKGALPADDYNVFASIIFDTIEYKDIPMVFYPLTATIEQLEKLHPFVNFTDVKLIFITLAYQL